MSKHVAIIGASDKIERYANKAMYSLVSHGYTVHLVNPFKSQINGSPCHPSVADIAEEIDTITLYVNPRRFNHHIDAVIKAQPRRVIMNPGTEDVEMERRLNNAGIIVDKACTLVLLSTNQF